MIYLISGVANIRLVNLEVDDPQCPLSNDDLPGPLIDALHPNFTNDLEVTLLDGANTTCLLPFDGGRRLLQLDFNVTDPVGGATAVEVDLVVMGWSCRHPSTVVMFSHANSSWPRAQFVECPLVKDIVVKQTELHVCSYVCSGPRFCEMGNMLLTLRFERMPSGSENYNNPEACTTSLKLTY